MDGHGHHHLHVRKRIYKYLEQYPHPETIKRLLDRAMVFIAMTGAAATIPQVYQVYAAQDAKGLSLISWSLWTGLSVLWILYGFLHKEVPIWASNLLNLVLNSAVVVAIFLYS